MSIARWLFLAFAFVFMARAVAAAAGSPQFWRRIGLVVAGFVAFWTLGALA